MTTVAVAGALANKHTSGGSAWVRMSWADALGSLGFDVLFVEQIAAKDCVDDAGRPASLATSANARHFRDATRAFGLERRSALICSDTGATIGLPGDELRERLAACALLVNISGHLRMPELLLRPARRAFVDLDPGYTQIWHARGDDAGALAGHDAHFTVGANVGGPRWTLPTADVDWIPLRQPVVLERWPVHLEPAHAGFTTVASWRGAYGPATWHGRTYGVKAHAFRRYVDLPRRVDARFTIALDIHPADAGDRTALEEAGWRLTTPEDTASIDGFRRFVGRSGAEFSAAQDIYVRTHSGWFSDRTVRYLASGRPALVQDTGFSDHLPVGRGLLAFSDLEGAVAGAEAIAGDYAAHRAAARALAERYFSPAAALGPLLERTGVAP